MSIWCKLHLSTWLYVLTTTLNASQFPGVKQVCTVLEQRIHKFQEEYSSMKATEYCAAIRQAALVHIFRSYTKVFQLFLNWITDSSERPLGEVEAFWSAAEKAI